MLHLDTIIDFLEPVNLFELSDDEGFRDTQLGSHIALHDEFFPDLANADMILVGCGESRGSFADKNPMTGPNAIRKEFYPLFHWHKDVKVADVGNVKAGATLSDTYAALRSVVNELLTQNKKIVILGGSHDLTIAQYYAYAALEQIIEAVCIDAKIDLDIDSLMPSENFLMEMLTGEPNFVRNYNHIGFQSYFVHPDMLQTIDRLRFDCFRVGRVKENMEEMEPVIRNAQLVSFDISAIKNSSAPANRQTPNGFDGEEACTLMQYAGMSNAVSSIGVYGFDHRLDVHNLTAKQISQMLWYFIDGISKGKAEASIDAHDQYNEFNMAFAEIETMFLQSKKTGRWWMQLPDGKYIACSHRDYVTASKNDIPERWLRAIERSSQI